MKKTVLTTAILCLFALCDVQAQIDNRYHWYDGTITYTATHLEHSNVKMYGMDEGELTRLKISLISGTTLSQVSEELGLAPLIIMSELQEYDYSSATTIALVMLVASFVTLFLVNVVQNRNAKILKGGS